MSKLIRIGTRDSQLAIWQATLVQQLLANTGVQSELVFIKSEGDIDVKTPLYEIGVQGIFTRSLDIALLENQIDIAVHSMKDVPTQLAAGILQAAVLERGSYKDILVYKNDSLVDDWQLANPVLAAPLMNEMGTIATSSIRRKAQWLNRYPAHTIENLRGNVNTRLRKLQEHQWDGAIFAAAGLERINLRPEKAIDLGWMLPAPAQGAIMIVCREADKFSFDSCKNLNHADTALCTRIERDFLRELSGGCSTPISALARVDGMHIVFKGNILSVDGKNKLSVYKTIEIKDAAGIGTMAATEILNKGAHEIAGVIHNAK